MAVALEVFTVRMLMVAFPEANNELSDFKLRLFSNAVPIQNETEAANTKTRIKFKTVNLLFLNS